MTSWLSTAFDRHDKMSLDRAAAPAGVSGCPAVEAEALPSTVPRRPANFETVLSCIFDDLVEVPYVWYGVDTRLAVRLVDGLILLCKSGIEKSIWFGGLGWLTSMKNGSEKQSFVFCCHNTRTNYQYGTRMYGIQKPRKDSSSFQAQAYSRKISYPFLLIVWYVW